MEINEWVFNVAYGKYSIDLGDSNAPCRNISELIPPGDFLLDYGVDKGTLALRELIAKQYGRSPNEVIVTHGAQEALFLYYFSFLSSGDHVITFKPGWKQSWEAPRKLGVDVTTLEISPQTGFNLESITEAIQDNTQAILLNSPSNPTGYSLSDIEKRHLCVLSEKFGITLICDDEYCVDLRKSLSNTLTNSISVSSLSKIYGLPGLRLGWALGEEDVISKMQENKHMTTISNSSYIESIAFNALNRRNEFISDYLRLWEQGRNIINAWVNKHSRFLSCAPITEAPFCWVKLSNNVDSLAFCKDVLDRESVLLMPSELFDASGAFRITFVREKDELIEGLSRIDKIIETVQ